MSRWPVRPMKLLPDGFNIPYLPSRLRVRESSFVSASSCTWILGDCRWQPVCFISRGFSGEGRDSHMWGSSGPSGQARVDWKDYLVASTKQTTITDTGRKTTYSADGRKLSDQVPGCKGTGNCTRKPCDRRYPVCPGQTLAILKISRIHDFLC